MAAAKSYRNFALKVFILYFALLGRAFSQAPRDVVLFLNLNGSDREVEGARRAATERGDLFEVIPDAEKEKKIRGLRDAVEKCSRTIDQSEVCKASRNEFKKLKVELEDVPSLVSEKLVALRGENKLVTSLVISGHDGGGDFHGDTGVGGIKKEELFLIFERYPSLRSVYLWGCYSTAPFEVREWVKSLPQLKMVAGFDGMAPSNERIEGIGYLHDGLLREKRLIENSDKTELERKIRGIAGINHTLAGLYVHSCQGEYYFLNRPKDEEEEEEDNQEDGFKRGRSFNAFDSQFKCSDIKTVLWSKSRILSDFSDGYKEPPIETQGSVLRSLYNFARQNYQCYKDNKGYNADLDPQRVGLMLFYNDVKKNFAAVFKELISAAAKDFHSIMDLESAQKALEEALASQRKLQESLKQSPLEIAKEAAQFDQEANDLEVKIRRLSSALPADVFKRLYNGMAQEREKIVSELMLPSRKKAAGELSDLLTGLSELSAKHLAFEKNMKDLQANGVLELKKADAAVAAAESRVKNISEFRMSLKKGYKEEDMFVSFTRAQIRSSIDVLAEAMRVDPEKSGKVREFRDKLERYLFNLDPRCMNMLEWHEFQPGQLPKPLCEDFKPSPISDAK